MKDKRIWQFKRRAEEDNFITAGACRLILRIASWRYCTRHHPADSEFALCWREMAAWYDLDGPEVVKNKRTVYGWLRELVLHHYLFYNGRKGCPATSCYRLDLNHKSQCLALFDWAAEHGRDVFKRFSEVQKTAQLEVQKTAQLEVQKNRQPVGRKNAPPIHSYSLREEMIRPKGKKWLATLDRKAGGSVGSLRSKGTKGSAECGASAPSAEGQTRTERSGSQSGSPAAAPDSASLRCASPGENLKLWNKAKKEAGL